MKSTLDFGWHDEQFVSALLTYENGESIEIWGHKDNPPANCTARVSCEDKFLVVEPSDTSRKHFDFIRHASGFIWEGIQIGHWEVASGRVLTTTKEQINIAWGSDGEIVAIYLGNTLLSGSDEEARKQNCAGSAYAIENGELLTHPNCTTTEQKIAEGKLIALAMFKSMGMGKSEPLAPIE